MRERGGRIGSLGLACIKFIYRTDKNKILLYSIGDYIQYLLINNDGKEYRKEYIYMCTLLLSHFSRVQLCATPIDSSLPGSPVLGILQARTLEWVAIAFSVYMCVCTYIYI